MDKILSDLSEQQKKAVTYDKGALLVLAGPGAGKTTVLTRKIAYILNQSQGQRFKVLALTFTTKAAKEMRERVESLVGDDAKRVFVGTFHAFCHDLIKAYGKYIRISSDFMIYEKAEDLIKLLIDAVRARVSRELKGDTESSILSIKYRDVAVIENTIPGFYYTFAKLKNRLIFPDNLDSVGKKYSEDFKIIFEIYNQELRKIPALDFSDLIYYAHKLLNEKAFIKKQLQTVYRYILIDEGQDTNKSQFELITTICGDSFKNLFVVADEDQMIFEWNDARFEYILSLLKKYKAETIQLYESYRCPPDVLGIANKLIKYNTARLETKEDLLPKKKKSGNAIEVKVLNDQGKEADFVCNRIKRIGCYTDICVISRNRYLLDEIRQKFEDLSIPYYMPMGQERFVTREMNFIINMMQFVFSESDKIRLYSVCDYLAIDYDLIAEEEGRTLLQNFMSIKANHDVLSKIMLLLRDFRNNKNSFKDYYDKLQLIIMGSDIEDEDLLSDIELFNDIHTKYLYDRGNEGKSLGDFLSYLSLSPKKDLSDKGVALLTGHAAKGLEFKYVFLVSLNQGVFPDYRAREGTRALEEERRNCFVAVTRTKEKLVISYTKLKNTRFGVREHKPSQFLEEMGLI